MISAVDAPSIYEIPLVLHEQGLDAYVCRTLGIDDGRRTGSTSPSGRRSWRGSSRCRAGCASASSAST